MRSSRLRRWWGPGLLVAASCDPGGNTGDTDGNTRVIANRRVTVAP